MLLLGSVPLVSGGCSSMLFWHPAPPLREAVWLRSSSGAQANSRTSEPADIFVLFETRYAERAALNPLSGTTLKRGYRVKLVLLQVPRSWPAGKRIPAAPLFADSTSTGPGQAGELKFQRLLEHSGWLLPDTLLSQASPDEAAGMLPKNGFWLSGNAGDAYGGPERRVYHVNAAGQFTALHPAMPVDLARSARHNSGGRRLYHDDGTGDFVIQID